MLYAYAAFILPLTTIAVIVVIIVVVVIAPVATTTTITVRFLYRDTIYYSKTTIIDT